MKKGVKWECDNCGADVLLKPLSLIYVVNGEFIYKDDTDCYDCGLCDNKVMYKTEESLVRDKCFDPEFVTKVRSDHSYLSADALDLLVLLLEYVDPKIYLCVLNDKKPLGVALLQRLTGFNEKKIDLLISELWRNRLAMQVKFNDIKRYFINGYALGLEDSYDRFIDKGMFSRDFFTKRNKGRESSQKRQARLLELPNTFTDEQKAELLREFNGKCAFTGKDVPIHIDHVIPIASGHGGTIVKNMLPIWQRINSSKSDRNIFEWYEKNGERFGVIPELFTQAIEYIAELNGMTYEEYRDYVYACHNAELTQTN